MRILILDTYYPAFLQKVYTHHCDWADLPYDEQWRRLMDECFGTADFYSTHLKKLGHEAHELVVNCLPLQKRWASEHGLPDKGAEQWKPARRRGWLPWVRKVANQEWMFEVVKQQIRDYAPDVLYVQDMGGISTTFLREMKDHVRFIAGQTAFVLPAGLDLGAYDLILSSFPHYISRFKAEGRQAAYFQLGFEPRVLERMQHADPRQNIVSFVGGLSADHAARLTFMEKVAQRVDLHVWGYGKAGLAADSPLRRFHHGEAWALDMYRVLRQSAITLNFHIDVAEDNANNMRLYEATGVGALLLTDAKKNLSDIFEPGKEVLTYASVEECLEKIEYYLAHPDEGALIAQAGQARTMREHTYAHRMQELSGILQSYL